MRNMTASDLRKPKEEPKKPNVGNPLPEAFLNAHNSPVRACGEFALPVWEVYEGPKTEPLKK